MPIANSPTPGRTLGISYSSWGRLLRVVVPLAVLTAVGTIGLKIVTGGRWVECLYFAIITLTTVGFNETLPLDDNGRLFIVGYLIVGLSVFTYSASQLGGWIVNVQMRQLLERRRMDKAIAKMQNHYIICGLGRMGAIICGQLAERKQSFVVIDSDDEVIRDKCEPAGWNYIEGDATDDAVLKAAGIERAKALAAVLATDADNIYVVLSARMLTQNLQIIARASSEKAVEKMQHAGATRVVSPFTTGAMKMARFMLNPSIEDFLEITDNRGNDLELADIQIMDDSPLVGKRLMDTDLRSRGVMVIGIRRSNGERLLPPPGSAIIMVGDSLFAFGSASAVNSIIGRDVELTPP